MRFKYFLSETIQNLKRNLLMTIAAISTVVIALLLLGGVQILGVIVGNMTATWEAKVEVSVYLRDDITDGERQALTSELTNMSEVVDVTYVSKADAYEEFKALYPDNPEFYETLPRDSLPASLRVKLTDANFAQLVASRIEGAPGVSDVRSGGEIVKTLLQVNSLLRTVTLGMSVVLMVAAAALIANTIRLAIYARRDEIGIMKLVGATNWFIRIPFMLEGLIAALVGALVSGLVVLLADSLLFDQIGQTFPFLRAVFSFTSGDIGGILLIMALVATGVGLVGSGLALRRFLEV
jgi:cell division transport system permease protein